MEFKSSTGVLQQWQINNFPILRKGILPCFWRALTDNDKGGEERSYAFRWKAFFLDRFDVHTTSFNIAKVARHVVQIEVTRIIRPKDVKDVASDKTTDHVQETVKVDSFKKLENNPFWFKVNVMYWAYGTDDLILQYNIEPNKELPRIGLVFEIDKSFKQVEWFGRRPFESYPDRKHAAHVGIYRKDVSDMHVPYIVPNENVGSKYKVYLKATLLLAVGAVMAGIVTFFISFIAMPFATHSSEAISALIFASRKIKNELLL